MNADTKARANAITMELRTTYPVFAKKLPLAIGTFDVVAAMYSQADLSAIKCLIRWHCKSDGYLKQCGKPDAQRFNLDGTPAGPVDPEHAEGARKWLKDRNTHRAAAKAARKAQAAADVKPKPTSPPEPIAPAEAASEPVRAVLDTNNLGAGGRPKITLKKRSGIAAA